VIRAIDDELCRIGGENGNHNSDNCEWDLPTRTRRRRTLPWLFSVIRFLLLDLSLLLLFILMLGTIFINHMFLHRYYPMMMSAKWRDSDRLHHEFTYYDRICDDSDVSSSSGFDFTINHLSTTDEAVRTMMTHGVIKVPSVLSDGISSALRTYILKRNGELVSSERIPLDGPENRWSFAIGNSKAYDL
jgi:hypothetical protein